MGDTIHSCSPDHKGILADDCDRCYDHANHPFAQVDHIKLAQLVALALTPERLNVAQTNADLVACKHILDAIDHVGRLLEAAPEAVVADLAKRWRIPIALVAT